MNLLPISFVNKTQNGCSQLPGGSHLPTYFPGLKRTNRKRKAELSSCPESLTKTECFRNVSVIVFFTERFSSTLNTVLQTSHQLFWFWSSLVTGLSRLLLKELCLRCLRRFSLERSLSKTSPERRADTRSSNSPHSSSAFPLAILPLCSLSFFICRQRDRL